MVDVEEGPLRALEEHVLARAQRALERALGVVDVGREPPAPLDARSIDGVDVDRRPLVELASSSKFFCSASAVEPLAQRRRVEQVGDADAACARTLSS